LLHILYKAVTVRVIALVDAVFAGDNIDSTQKINFFFPFVQQRDDRRFVRHGDRQPFKVQRTGAFHCLFQLLRRYTAPQHHGVHAKCFKCRVVHHR